jgi:hypothetical protein
MSDTESATAAKPAKSATTNPPKDTFVDATIAPADGYLLYGPGDNSFIALYPDEFFEIRKEAEDNNKAIHELQEANQAVTEKSVALAELLRNPTPTQADVRKAQDELDQALATLGVKSEEAKTKIEKITNLDADPKKLVELLPLTLAKDARDRTYYVKAEKLKKAAADKRVYLVEGKAEREKRPAEKLMNGTKLNGAEVKRRIADKVVDKARFEKKWKLKPKDGDEYAGQFFSEWSKSMGAPAKDFLEREQKAIVEGIFGPVNSDSNDPHRKVDMKSEAQLMRWAAGAGLEANVQGFQGNIFDKRDKDWKSRFKRAAKAAQFNIKANAEASFALGEAKVDTTAYYPHYAGWHLTPSGAGIALDLGYFRLRGDMALYAVAGASIAIEASAGLMLTAGKQGLRGVPRDAKAVKAKASADGKVELFAGLKEGIDLAGSLQWLNPEGFIDPKSPKRKDATKTWGEYADVASVTAGVAGMEGLAASLGFEVGYRNGNFVIAAKASGCLGLGGSGNVTCKVGADSIGQFFMCVAHQLKQADFHKLSGLMQEQVFYAMNQAIYMVQSGEKALSDFANSTYQTVGDIQDAYQSVLRKLRHKGAEFIYEMERRMREGWGWYAYMPPEARGAMIASLNEVVNQPQYAQNQDLRQAAAFAVNEFLATGQTSQHLFNTLDRITVSIGDLGDRADGVRTVNALLENSSFAGGLDRALNQVASAQPLIQRPFMRNDEASFVVAQMGFSHAMTVA